MVVRFIVSGDDVNAAVPPAGVPPAGDPSRGLSTVGSGKPCEVVDERQPNGSSAEPAKHPNRPSAPSRPGESDDIAQQALAQARHFNQGSHQQRERKRRRRRPSEGAGYSAAGPDDRDPQLLGGVLQGLVGERGWQRPLAEARVFADWASLVGADIAEHCRPVSLNAGELRIVAESTAWATQLQLMASALLASFARELGPEVVRKVFITGPTGPSWKHGGWSVRGARGPRDTYG
jgi:predicted nucleic acid-binding Zn ribbon protein